MPTPSVTCPKCSGRMVRGYVLDNTEGGRLLGRWSEGEPKKSFLAGIKPPTSEQIPIGTYRCASCGFLESWAQSGFKAT